MGLTTGRPPVEFNMTKKLPGNTIPICPRLFYYTLRCPKCKDRELKHGRYEPKECSWCSMLFNEQIFYEVVDKEEK